MEDYSIIQGQTILELMFALLLTLTTIYVCISCRAYAQRMNAVSGTRSKSLCQPSSDANQTLCPLLQCAPPSAKHKCSFSDWLAPIIVWAAVIWTMMAVVSILLGES
jgi:hypothetical protein